MPQQRQRLRRVWRARPPGASPRRGPGGRPASHGSVPRTCTVPESGRRSPSRHSTIVVFPAPLGPRSAVTMPAAAVQEAPSTAWSAAESTAQVADNTAAVTAGILGWATMARIRRGRPRPETTMVTIDREAAPPSGRLPALLAARTGRSRSRGLLPAGRGRRLLPRPRPRPRPARCPVETSSSRRPTARSCTPAPASTASPRRGSGSRSASSCRPSTSTSTARRMAAGSPRSTYRPGKWLAAYKHESAHLNERSDITVDQSGRGADPNRASSARSSG